MALVVILAVVLMVMLSLPLVLMLVIFGFRKEAQTNGVCYEGAHANGVCCYRSIPRGFFGATRK